MHGFAEDVIVNVNVKDSSKCLSHGKEYMFRMHGHLGSRVVYRSRAAQNGKVLAVYPTRNTHESPLHQNQTCSYTCHAYTTNSVNQRDSRHARCRAGCPTPHVCFEIFYL